MLGIEMGLFFLFFFSGGLEEYEGREGGWHFGEERGKGGRFDTIEGGGVLSFFSGSGV